MNHYKEILDDIFLIEIPLPGNPLKNTNSYLIKGRDRDLLIDTAFNRAECLEALTSALDALGVDFARTDVFLTHLHSDHTGLSGSIGNDDTKRYIGHLDKALMEQFFHEAYWEKIDARYMMLGFTKSALEENRRKNPASIYLPIQKPLTAVYDGDIIDLGNYKLKCIETPGHTPGHMCLYLEERQILFSGDHIIFDITPNIAMWELDDHSLKDYINSLEKIKTLTITETLSGHRNALGDCHSRVDHLIEHHAERLAEALMILKDYPESTVYNVASRMTWSIRAKGWDDFPMAQKWFAVSEAGSHLEYLKGQKVVDRETRDGIYRYTIHHT